MKTSRTTSFDGWMLRADIGELVRDGRRIRLQQRHRAEHRYPQVALALDDIFWWYYGEFDPMFRDVGGDPRFQALVTRGREHHARQRALLDDMRRKGEVPTR